MLMGYLRELHGEFYYFMGRYIPHGAIIGAIEDRIVAVIYQYLTSLSSGKCEVKMLSKMNFLNLAEEAVCKQKVAEFVETVASNHASLSKYLESDENFNSSFRMSCIRLAATSSYVYHFLAAIKLVGEDRPTTFPSTKNPAAGFSKVVCTKIYSFV